MAEISLLRIKSLLSIIIIILSSSASTSKTSPINISNDSVPEIILQSAITSFNQQSPIHQLMYKNGNLITAQKLTDLSSTIYLLKLNFEIICGQDPCPHEICTINIKQNHHQNIIEILEDSKQCSAVVSFQQNSIIDMISRKIIVDTSSTHQISHHEVDDVTRDHSDQSDKPFVAVRGSGQVYCPGCPYPLNPTLPGLEKYAELVAKSMDEFGHSDFKYKIINIATVTRAIPPGGNIIRYEFLMEIGQSNCLQTIQINRQDCQLQLNIPTIFCLVVVDESPLITYNSRPQLLHNNCTISSNKINEINSNIEQSVKVENNNESDSLLPSSSSSIIFNESKTELYDQLAVEGQFITDKSLVEDNDDDDSSIKISSTDIFPSNNEQNKKTISEEPFKNIHLNTENIDNLQNTKFIDKLKDFDEFLKNFDVPIKKKVTETMNNDSDNENEEIIKPIKIELKNKPCIINQETTTREKRSLNKEENFIKTLSQKAMDSLDEIDKDNNKRKIVDILESRKIVNDDILYQITLLVEPMTNCIEKSLINESKNCTQKKNEPMHICKIQIKIADKMKLENARLLQLDCKPSNSSTKKRRHENDAIDILGGNEAVSTVNDKLSIKIKKRSLRGTNYSKKMLTISKQIELERKFNQFKKKYNKTYSSEQERQIRLRIFEKNMKLVEELQAGEQGTAIYGASIFADMTPYEFKQTHLGYRKEFRSENNIPLANAEIPSDNEFHIPEEFDWRHYNAVTGVKDQGSCGSCWAFSVTGNIEGQYAIKYGKLLSLSEQELVDCDSLDDGCNGGLQENAYRALESLGGLELEQDYPYDAKDETCQFKKNMAKVQVVSAVNITSNETQMAQWLIKNGPMAIAINANAMQFYMGGISHPFKFLCNKNNLDHGVLIVGYGIHRYPLFKKTMPFWIIKNSWGSRWGEQGYYRVYRGDGTCGLNTDVTSAIVQ